MSRKNPLRVIHQPKDGPPVVGGLFQMHDTMGFPLVESLCQCKFRGWTPGIYDFIRCARIDADWSWEKIRSTVLSAWLEAYGQNDPKLDELKNVLNQACDT
jgi:hypothetical protein